MKFCFWIITWSCKLAQRGVNFRPLHTDSKPTQGGAMGRTVMPTAGSQKIHTAPKITSQFAYPYCLNFLSILIQNTFRNGRQTLTRDSYICVFSFLLLHSGLSYLNSVESWLNITAARFPTLRLITKVETLSHTGNFLACNSKQQWKVDEAREVSIISC